MLLEGRSCDGTIGWSPAPLAQDCDGEPCDPADPYAAHWSISGAIQATAFGETTSVATVETIALALAEEYSGSLISWEAQATPADVADLLRKAECFVRKAKDPTGLKDLLK